jgi:hypothetical protein
VGDTQLERFVYRARDRRDIPGTGPRKGAVQDREPGMEAAPRSAGVGQYLSVAACLMTPTAQ